MEDSSASGPQGSLTAQQIQHFFVLHLDRVYCVKAHLQERLPEISNYSGFIDLTKAISETQIVVDKQVARMDEIYGLLGLTPQLDNCQAMIGLIEDAFSAIYLEDEDRQMRDLSILLYLQNIESLESTSFRLLNLAAPLLAREKIHQLLLKNFNEAREDLAMLQLITRQYFTPDCRPIS